MKMSDVRMNQRQQRQQSLFLKPDFSPDYLENYCYIRHLCCIRKTVFLQTLKENDGNPAIEEPIAGRQSSPIVSSIFPKCSTIQRRSMHREVEHASMAAGSHEKKQPLVSILIPNKDEKLLWKNASHPFGRAATGIMRLSL